MLYSLPLVPLSPASMMMMMMLSPALALVLAVVAVMAIVTMIATTVVGPKHIPQHGTANARSEHAAHASHAMLAVVLQLWRVCARRWVPIACRYDESQSVTDMKSSLWAMTGTTKLPKRSCQPFLIAKVWHATRCHLVHSTSLGICPFEADTVEL